MWVRYSNLIYVSRNKYGIYERMVANSDNVAHLLGGFFIIIGLFKRLSTLFLIPILLGAVLFINLPRGIFAPGSEFGFSLAVLLLLIVFFIEGGCPLSLDNYFMKNQDQQ